MSYSRTKNAKRNMVSGFINRAVALMLPFIIRTVVIRVFGAEYLGLGSLFTSILQVLSLAELGFSSAIVFSLYKPLAEEDTLTVRALLAFYKHVYRIVGLAVFAIGLILMPFLRYLIHSDVPSSINIYILYSIFLVNSVISYFAFAYRSSLLTADQRQDTISNISTILSIVIFGLQLPTIFVFKNYYLFAGLNIVSTIANNILVAIVTKKRYPNYYCEGELELKKKVQIKTQVKGLAITKVANIARNSFDSIVISMFLGLIKVTIYSNYYLIMNSILGFMSIIMTSLSAGVGNSIAVESVDKNYADFKRLHYYISWIASWCTICLLCLYQPFMELWAGKNLMESDLTMSLFCVYFYILQLTLTRSVYASAAGLWWEFRWLEIGEMISNLLLNFVLGYYLGIRGILLATIITVLVFSVIGNTNITYKLYFHRNSKEYHLTNLVYAMITVISGFITYFLCSIVSGLNTLFILMIRIVICVVVPNALLFVASFMYPDYKSYLAELKAIFRR